MKVKYPNSKYWCFAWSKGKPSPFLLPGIGGWYKSSAMKAAVKHFHNDWDKLHQQGARLIHCTVIPVNESQRKLK